MDWKNWTPRERATLCFIEHEGRMLLIRKKRGLGGGKINGPGGRLEPGETIFQGAVRETQEEVGLTPLRLEKRGELHFQFLDGYSLFCTVFSAYGFEGKLIETDEADPFWVDLDAIPYDGMWEDDIHWLPLVIAKTNFRGYFEFDDERLLNHHVDHVVAWEEESVAD